MGMRVLRSWERFRKDLAFGEDWQVPSCMVGHRNITARLIMEGGLIDIMLM